jgi:hypothetical protein
MINNNKYDFEKEIIIPFNVFKIVKALWFGNIIYLAMFLFSSTFWNAYQYAYNMSYARTMHYYLSVRALAVMAVILFVWLNAKLLNLLFRIKYAIILKPEGIIYNSGSARNILLRWSDIDYFEHMIMPTTGRRIKVNIPLLLAFIKNPAENYLKQVSWYQKVQLRKLIDKYGTSLVLQKI